MQHLPRLRVLVIEEQPVLQKILCNLVVCCGMAARPVPVDSGTAGSVARSLAAAEAETDLVLLGWSSLMADSAEVWQFLRQPEGLRIPCIVHVSAAPGADAEPMQQLRSMGIDTVLPRQFSSQKLHRMVLAAAEAAVPARRQWLQSQLQQTPAPPARELPVAPAMPGSQMSAHAGPSFAPGAEMLMPIHLPPPVSAPVSAPVSGGASQLASPSSSATRPSPPSSFSPELSVDPPAVAPAPPPSQPEETPAAKARRLFGEGREALKSRDHDRAIAAFSKILAMRGRFPEVCRGLAIAWQRKGDVARFAHYLNKAAEGYVWRGNNAEAESLFRNMVRHRCRALNPYQAVGEVLLQRGRAELALTIYEKAQALDPDDAGVRVVLARLYRKAGRIEDALEHVAAVLQRDGRHEAALALYAELTGKDWHQPDAGEAGPEIWEVDSLAVCEDLEASGPVLFLDGDAPQQTPFGEPLDMAAGTAQAVPPGPGPEAVTAAAVAAPAPRPAGPRKVLIVDDEPHIRMLLEETLESLEEEGVILLYAEHGEEGLQLIKDELPDLVFLDVMMPRMNGFDVCDWVKNKLSLDGVYVVMLTAKGQEFDAQRGMEVGADVYMTKPFRPAEVLVLARTVLGMD
ncbi:response regulator [Megalodesulfovibrio paquesii]